MSCIFCRIASREVPATIAYEDEQVIAFRDLNPKAPVHMLIIPRAHVASLGAAGDEHKALLGQALLVARRLAEEHGVADSGFRVVINTNADAGQSVDHLHIHLLGGRQLGWPPG